jgi:hypothetical protein
MTNEQIEFGLALLARMVESHEKIAWSMEIIAIAADERNKREQEE